MSFCLLSSGTIGSPSTTINVSRLSSSLTSYCAFRSNLPCQHLPSNEGGDAGQVEIFPPTLGSPLLTGEVNLLLLFLVKILLGQGIETGRHDRDWGAQALRAQRHARWKARSMLLSSFPPFRAKANFLCAAESVLSHLFYHVISGDLGQVMSGDLDQVMCYSALTQGSRATTRQRRGNSPVHRPCKSEEEELSLLLLGVKAGVSLVVWWFRVDCCLLSVVSSPPPSGPAVVVARCPVTLFPSLLLRRCRRVSRGDLPFLMPRRS